MFLCLDSDFDFTVFLVGDLKEEIGEGKSDSISRTFPLFLPLERKTKGWAVVRRTETARRQSGKGENMLDSLKNIW